MFDSVSNKKLDAIIEITERLEGSALKEDALNSIDDKLEEVAEYIGESKECALFFSVIFVLQNRDFNQVSLHDISDFLDYPFIQLILFRTCLNELEKAGLISLKQIKNSSPHAENNGYNISGTVMNCVIDGNPIVKITPEKDTIESVLDEILRIQAVYSDDNMPSTEYGLQISDCEKRHSENVMIKNVTGLFPDDFESRAILYNLLCPKVIGEEFCAPSSRDESPEFILYSILPRPSGIKRKSLLKDGSDILFQKNLIRKNYEMSEGGYRTRCAPILRYVLTTEGLNQILGDQAKNYEDAAEESTETDLTLQIIHEIAYEYEKRGAKLIKAEKMGEIERRNKELTFFKQMMSTDIKPESRFILYDCINDYLAGCNSALSATLSDLYGKTQKYFDVMRSFLDEKNPLIEENFLEINKEEVVDKSTITISDKTLEFLYGKNADMYKRNSSEKNVYLPEKIKSKTLFYSDEVQKQIDMLSESLSAGNFEAMQKRLEDKGLCKGVAVILYGAPGTGKTESVYQIAKKTNRQIMHVDIADSKSMWFGESEKQIKKIFTKYRNLCKVCKGHHENTPILLFNEADAIISKRKDIEGSNVGQTENAMQNILLEEMEKLDGIMIATTNLCENMDKAFERRFLFKIKFEKPAKEARLLIWKSKMPELDEETAKKLSEAYDFSGGEIDNVVRKCEMNEIIKGQKPDYELLKEFCSKERLASEEIHHMGFSL